MKTDANHSPTRPLRIAYLLADPGIPFTESKKGCSIHVRSIIKAFEEEGCDVASYVLRKGGGKIGDFHVRQVRRSRFRKWWVSKWTEGGLWRRFWPFAPTDAAAPNWMTAVSLLLMQRDFHRSVLRRLRKRKPDMLYARSSWFTWPYVKLKRQLGVPLVLEVNASFSIEKNVRGEMAFSGLTRSIEGTMFREADLVLPVSEEIRRQVLGFGADPEKVKVLPNAVDLDLFRPREEKEERDGKREAFVVGSVSSMRTYHGMGTLLRAAASLAGEIPELRLLLVGGGKELGAARDLARELGLQDKVEFTGVAANDKVPDLLRRCDLCVAPYEGEENQYGCPMKLFEYMALKIPIVASEWGDIPNILTHGETALLHEEGNPLDLAEKIRRVRNQPDMARDMAERAYKVVAEKHTWRKRARYILDWNQNFGR